MLAPLLVLAPQEPDIDLARFDAAFRTALQAAAEKRKLAGLLEAARKRLPDGDPRRVRLAGDCRRLERMPADKAAGLWKALKELGQPPDGERELFGRCLQRDALRRVGARDKTGAQRAADAAVRIAIASGDGQEKAYAYLVRGLLAYRMWMFRLADWRVLETSENDLAAAEKAFRARGLRAMAGATAYYRALCTSDSNRPVETLGHLARAILDLGEYQLVELDARTRRIVTCVNSGDWSIGDGDVAWVEKRIDKVRGKWRVRGACHALTNWNLRRPDRTGETDEDRLARAAEFCERWLAATETDYGRAVALWWRAHVGANRGRIAQARTDIEEARRLSLRCGQKWHATHCLVQSAWIELRDGKPRAALDVLAKHEKELHALPSARPQWWRDHCKIRALAAEAAGDADGAMQALEKLVRVEDDMLRTTELDYRVFFGEQATQTHAQLVQLLARRSREAQKPEPRKVAFARATAVIEHVRARLLRWALEERRPVERERVVSPELGSPRVEPLPNGVAEFRWFVTAAPVPAARPEHYVLLARVGSEVRFEDLGRRREIDAAIRKFRRRWMSTQGLGLPASDYMKEADELSALLFGGARKWLTQSEPPVRRLVLMTDGEIERVPFAALVTPEKPEGSGYAGLPYLVKRCAILHVPSLAILHRLAPPSGKASALLVVHEGGDARPETPALPAAAAERAAVERTYAHVKTLHGPAATAGGVRRALDGSHFGWLHVLAHAVPGKGLGRPAQILLAGAPLDAGKVEKLPLPAGIRVVLSACASADGDFHRGEGVLGLWRAFLLGGASCVVATLDPVEDKSAAAWMRGFHASAVRGRPVADAVRDATLGLLRSAARRRYPRGSSVRDAAHPFLWASYVCVGRDGGPMY